MADRDAPASDTASAAKAAGSNDFAPEYTAAERLRLLLVLALPIAGLLAILEFIGLPWLKVTVARNPCAEYLGYDLHALVFYGLFAGIPLLTLLLALPLLALRGWRIIGSQQLPPPGEKVWRRTRIRRGSQARLAGVVHLIGFVITVAFLLWGITTAGRLQAKLEREHPNRCAPGQPPLSRTI